MSEKSLPPGNAQKTYRYLRIGLIGCGVLLAASVLYEAGANGWSCFQTSISGYYYTPVRAVFVGALLAIGLALIVIKAETWEDLWLNLAGMMAPVVALVPTRNLGACWSITPEPSPLESVDPPVLADWVVRNITNNIWALLITGAVGVIAAYVLYSVTQRSVGAAFDL